MGYIFISFALLAGVTKGYCGKKTSSYISDSNDAAFSNLIRMLLCAVFGFLLVVFQGGYDKFLIDSSTFIISLSSAFFTSMFVITWLLIVRKGAYMTVDVFITLGIIIPLTLCRIFYNEPVSVKQLVGIAILFTAAFVMCSYNNSIKEKISISTLGLLILCGAANGMTDFSQKLYIYNTAQPNISIFNFYTYLFSTVFLLIFCTVTRTKNDEKGLKIKFVKKIFGYVAVMSVCLFLNSYFKTMAAMYLSSAQLYPLNQGAGLILSSVMAAMFFHERINLKCIVGIALTFLSLIIIN